MDARTRANWLRCKMSSTGGSPSGELMELVSDSEHMNVMFTVQMREDSIGRDIEAMIDYVVKTGEKPEFIHYSKYESIIVWDDD